MAKKKNELAESFSCPLRTEKQRLDFALVKKFHKEQDDKPMTRVFIEWYQKKATKIRKAAQSGEVPA